MSGIVMSAAGILGGTLAALAARRRLPALGEAGWETGLAAATFAIAIACPFVPFLRGMQLSFLMLGTGILIGLGAAAARRRP